MGIPQIKTQRINATTSTAGAATAYGEYTIVGFGLAVEWIDGDFADGVDAVVSVTQTPSGVDKTLLTLTDANADAFYNLRELEYGNTGASLGTYTLPLITGLVKLVVSSGGDTKTGGIVVYYHSQ